MDMYGNYLSQKCHGFIGYSERFLAVIHTSQLHLSFTGSGFKNTQEMLWQFEADGVGCQIVVLCPVLGKFTKISSSLGIQL